MWLFMENQMVFLKDKMHCLDIFLNGNFLHVFILCLDMSFI